MRASIRCPGWTCRAPPCRIRRMGASPGDQTRKLTVTEPFMTGDDVKAAQRVLHDNRFKINFRPGQGRQPVRAEGGGRDAAGEVSARLPRGRGQRRVRAEPVRLPGREGRARIQAAAEHVRGAERRAPAPVQAQPQRPRADGELVPVGGGQHRSDPLRAEAADPRSRPAGHAAAHDRLLRLDHAASRAGRSRRIPTASPTTATAAR